MLEQHACNALAEVCRTKERLHNHNTLILWAHQQIPVTCTDIPALTTSLTFKTSAMSMQNASLNTKSETQRICWTDLSYSEVIKTSFNAECVKLDEFLSFRVSKLYYYKIKHLKKHRVRDTKRLD